MKILVTGAAGFVGFHTSKKLLDRGDSLFAAKYDALIFAFNAGGRDWPNRHPATRFNGRRQSLKRAQRLPARKDRFFGEGSGAMLLT